MTAGRARGAVRSAELAIPIPDTIEMSIIRPGPVTELADVADLKAEEGDQQTLCNQGFMAILKGHGTRSGVGGDASERARASTDDSDLVALVEIWPILPEPIKAGIVAMVRASHARPAVAPGVPVLPPPAARRQRAQN